MDIENLRVLSKLAAGLEDAVKKEERLAGELEDARKEVDYLNGEMFKLMSPSWLADDKRKIKDWASQIRRICERRLTDTNREYSMYLMEDLAKNIIGKLGP